MYLNLSLEWWDAAAVDFKQCQIKTFSGAIPTRTDMLYVGIIESQGFFYSPCYVMMRAVNKSDGTNPFNESALSSG